MVPDCHIGLGIPLIDKEWENSGEIAEFKTFHVAERLDLKRGNSLGSRNVGLCGIADKIIPQHANVNYKKAIFSVKGTWVDLGVDCRDERS